jgi:hypothetical protein
MREKAERVNSTKAYVRNDGTSCWMPFPVISCDIHGGRSGIRAGLCPTFFGFLLLIIVPPLLLTHLSPPLRRAIALITQHIITFSGFKLRLELWPGTWLVTKWSYFFLKKKRRLPASDYIKLDRLWHRHIFKIRPSLSAGCCCGFDTTRASC